MAGSGLLAFVGTSNATRGQVVTEFDVPTDQPERARGGARRQRLVHGGCPGSIGRMTPAGTYVTFPGGGASRGITAGPDGNLWFTYDSQAFVGRITTAGDITDLPITVTGARGITTGPDGNLWIAEVGDDKIGRLTTAGALTEFPVLTAGSAPVDIVSGPDGNLWFAEANSSKVGRITTQGVVTEFPVLSADAGVVAIAAGPDGNLWFSEHRRQQDRTHHHDRRRHRVSDPDRQQRRRGASRPAPTAISGSSKRAPTRSAGSRRPASSPKFPIPTADSAAGRHRRGPGRKPLVRRAQRPQDRPHHHRRGHAAEASRRTSGRCSGSDSNINGVLEPGETVQVAPFWKNTLTTPQPLAGTASNLTGPAGPTYTIDDASADYGTVAAGATADCHSATGDCYLMTVAGARPVSHWDATFQESLTPTGKVSHTWTTHVGKTFTDVPTSNPFYFYVESLVHSGVTSGCGTGVYCPNNSITRAQMAVFLLKAKFGAAHVPPPATGTVFNDVHVGDFAAAWIEELAGFQITGGCGGGNYCPNAPVTRAQMSVFLLKTEHGSALPAASLHAALFRRPLPEPLRRVDRAALQRGRHRRLRRRQLLPQLPNLPRPDGRLPRQDHASPGTSPADPDAHGHKDADTEPDAHPDTDPDA